MPKIDKVNLRATALAEFWGEEYEQACFLSEGASRFFEKEGGGWQKNVYLDYPVNLEDGHAACKDIYDRVLPKLATCLNRIHELDLPEKFWRTVFGWTLFRFIFRVYETFMCLEAIDIDQSSIKLLDQDSFVVPRDGFDWVGLFSIDFGTQQLVTQYYNLFARKENPSISYHFKEGGGSSIPLSILEKLISVFQQRRIGDVAQRIFKRLLIKISNRSESCQILIHNNCSIKESLLSKLFFCSLGKIAPFSFPQIESANKIIDINKRQGIGWPVNDADRFERYLVDTFSLGLPRMLIEDFRIYYDICIQDVKNKPNLRYLVSEDWVSNLKTSIYVAISQQHNIKHVALQHSAVWQLLRNSNVFLDYSATDIYLTTGWENKRLSHVVKGGFSRMKKNCYTYSPKKKHILFMSTTFFIYNNLITGSIPLGKNIPRYFRNIRQFFKKLSPAVLDDILYRPRKADQRFWDVAGIVCKDMHISLDDSKSGSLAKILESKIVIIDHISSGFAELLFIKVPFILIHDPLIFPLEDEYATIFHELMEVGVVHQSPESVAAFLNQHHERIWEWWNSPSLQNAVESVCDQLTASPSVTEEYLMSLLTK